MRKSEPEHFHSVNYDTIVLANVSSIKERLELEG